MRYLNFLSIFSFVFSFSVTSFASEDFGPGGQSFSTDSSGSATESYEAAVRSDPDSFSNETTGFADVDSYNGRTSSSTSSDSGWGNEDHSGGDFSSPSGAAGPTGSTTNAWADVWDLEKCTTCGGEFGEKVGDYEAHEKSIQQAIKDANAAVYEQCGAGDCSNDRLGSDESGLVRVEALNESYYSGLADNYAGSTLPKGPMETMDRYWGKDETHPDFIGLRDDIDQGVRDGDFGAVLPGHFDTAFPGEELDDAHIYAAQATPVIVDRTPIDPETGLTKLETLNKEAFTAHLAKYDIEYTSPKNVGFHAPNGATGGPNGAVGLVEARGGINSQTLREELFHAAQARLQSTFRVTNEDDIVGFGIDGTNLSDDEANELLGEVEKGIPALIRSRQSKGSFPSIDETVCDTCAQIAEKRPYVATYLELQAKFTRSKDKNVVVEHIAVSISKDKNTTKEQARALAEDLYDSGVIQKDVEDLNKLSRIAMDNKF